MDNIECEAIRAEGGDPHDPAVQLAHQLVRLELALLGTETHSSERAKHAYRP